MVVGRSLQIINHKAKEYREVIRKLQNIVPLSEEAKNMLEEMDAGAFIASHTQMFLDSQETIKGFIKEKERIYQVKYSAIRFLELAPIRLDLSGDRQILGVYEIDRFCFHSPVTLAEAEAMGYDLRTYFFKDDSDYLGWTPVAQELISKKQYQDAMNLLVDMIGDHMLEVPSATDCKIPCYYLMDGFYGVCRDKMRLFDK